MKKVEVIEIPMRYNSKTYVAGESFEMDELDITAIEEYINVIPDEKPAKEKKAAVE